MKKEEKDDVEMLEIHGRIIETTKELLRLLAETGEKRSVMHIDEVALVMLVPIKAEAEEVFPLADGMIRRWERLDEIAEGVRKGTLGPIAVHLNKYGTVPTSNDRS